MISIKTHVLSGTGTQIWDARFNKKVSSTLTGNVTYNVGGIDDGDVLTLFAKQDATGARTVAFTFMSGLQTVVQSAATAVDPTASSSTEIVISRSGNIVYIVYVLSTSSGIPRGDVLISDINTTSLNGAFVLGRSSASGPIITLLLASAASPSSIAYRAAGGVLKVGPPVATDDAVNKAYYEAQSRLNGVTGSRPAAPAIGQFYFDTTLGKPIWWKGAVWVDGVGTTS